GDVVDVKTHKIVGLLRDEYGRHMDSEKVLDLAFNLEGKMVRKVNEFAIGDPRPMRNGLPARNGSKKPADRMISFPDFARLPKCGRAFLLVFLSLGTSAHNPANAQLPARPVIDPAKELAAIKAASTLDSDPADSQTVQQVCTACHSS